MPSVIPVNLGCCPEPPRCMLCPPSPRVDAALVEGLITAYTTRDGARGPFEVRFFGGPPPSDALLRAAKGHPISVRARPDLLSRDDAARLEAAGVHQVELDLGTTQPEALAQLGRPYRRARLEAMVTGLRALGMDVGGVLAPGLPGSSHAAAVRDAHWAAANLDFVRIHPVLVYAGSSLRDALEAGRYVPLTVAEAVTTCRAMVDILEPAGVSVVRIGVQPAHDGVGRAVAGPVHGSLRELVEARRALDHLQGMLDGTPAGQDVVIHCAPADETRTRGPHSANVRALRADHGLASLVVRPDPALTRGTWSVTLLQDTP